MSSKRKTSRIDPKSIGKTKKNDHLDEEDLMEYLSKNDDNIVVAIGHKINFAKRSEIASIIENGENCYSDEKGNKYYQFIGRPLISEEDMNKILEEDCSIFNISVLTNVLKVFNMTNPKHKHLRSIYIVDAYHLDDYGDSNMNSYF